MMFRLAVMLAEPVMYHPAACIAGTRDASVASFLALNRAHPLPLLGFDHAGREFLFVNGACVELLGVSCCADVTVLIAEPVICNPVASLSGHW